MTEVDKTSSTEDNTADQMEAKQETEPESKSETVSTNPQKMPELALDPEFKSLIPPLEPGELAALKKSIDEEGCRDSLVTCKLDGIITLLDGHHRLEICKKLGRSFRTTEIKVSSRNEAKIWIIKNQRGRRNLNESQRAMLAVTLEALYGEQAEKRKGVRTDLDPNLDQGEFGRSDEKAAKDMGVSHQSVAYAKKVTSDGIPELKQMVEARELAVSTAARVAKLSKEDQREVNKEIVKKVEEKTEPGEIKHRVTSNEIADIIRKLSTSESGDSSNNVDENLVKVETKLNGVMKTLKGFETTRQPGKLVELITLGEKVIARMKAIGLKSPSLRQKADYTPGEYQLEIDAKPLKLLLESVVPTKEGIKLKFESDGLKIIEANGIIGLSSSFLPKSYFSKYELEPCEICLRDISELSKYLWKGKVRIFVEPAVEYHHDHMMHIYSGYEPGDVMQEYRIRLTRPEFIREDIKIPDLTTTCKIVVSISSKDFVGSLRDITRIKTTNENGERRPIYMRNAEFSVEDSFLKIVAEKDGLIQKIPCNVLMQGKADSKFNIAYLIDNDIGNVIEKSNTIVLGLGKNYPLVMDLAIGKMEIRYMLAPLTKIDQPEEYEEYRGVLVDQEVNPVKSIEEPVDQEIKDNVPAETNEAESAEASETFNLMASLDNLIQAEQGT